MKISKEKKSFEEIKIDLDERDIEMFECLGINFKIDESYPTQQDVSDSNGELQERRKWNIQIVT